MPRFVALAAVMLGCGRIGFDPRDGGPGGDGASIDGPLVLGGTRVTDDPGASRCPSVAASATGFGVAWVDDRAGGDDLYFVRLDASGARLGADVRLTATAAPSGCPRLISTGAEWAVVWPEGAAGVEDVYFLSLFPDGTPLGSYQVTNDGAGSTAPGLAFDGTSSTFGLVWESHSGQNTSIEYKQLSGSGQPGPAATIASSGADNRGPAIAWGANVYGIAWGNDNGPGEDVGYLAVTPPASPAAPVVVAPLFFATSTKLALSYADGEFAAVWRDDYLGNTRFHFCRIAESGAATAPVELSIAGYDIYDAHQELVATSTGFALVWALGETKVYLQRLDAAGMGDEPSIITAGTGSAPSAARLDATVGIAWQDTRDGNDEIYFVVSALP